MIYAVWLPLLMPFLAVPVARRGAEQLRPRLRPRYVAAVQTRVYIEGADRAIAPDVWLREVNRPVPAVLFYLLYIAGVLIFVSGTLGSGDGLALVSGGIAAETTQTLRNIERILSIAGATWDDVVKVSVFIADMNEFGAMNEAYSAFEQGFMPRTTQRIQLVTLA